MKRRIFSVLCGLLLSVLSINVFAVEVPDFARKGSISVTMSYQGNAVPGGSLTIYRVAEIHEENGADYSFRYTADYAGCQYDLDDLTTAKLAQDLADYTAAKNVKGKTAKIDGNGRAFFDELELGLYLVIQEEAAPGFNAVSPFMIAVPGRQGDRYLYEVDGSPKLSLERAPTETTKPTTQPTLPPKLPQTGQTKWPVPILMIGGLIFVVLGLVFCVSGKRKSDEV